MNIFISYNATDIPIVEEAYANLKNVGDINFWNKDKIIGDVAWDSIFSWIDKADLVVVIITQNTLQRAMSVGQEIGRAKAKGKTILPLVAKGINASDLGCLQGVSYEILDIDNPSMSLTKISDHCLTHKKRSEEESKSLFLLLGIIAFILFASKS